MSYQSSHRCDCQCACMYVCVFACLCVCEYLCVCARARARVCVCVCFVYVVHTHTHTHTHTLLTHSLTHTYLHYLIRRRNKRPVYELLPAGEAVALRLLASKLNLSLLPDGTLEQAAPTRGPLIAYSAPSRDTAAADDDDSLELVLIVDSREGGGEEWHINRIVEALRRSGRLSFETRQIPTGLGDYVWVVRHRKRKDQGERLVPIVVERKTPVQSKCIFFVCMPCHVHLCLDTMHLS